MKNINVDGKQYRFYDLPSLNDSRYGMCLMCCVSVYDYFLQSIKL